MKKPSLLIPCLFLLFVSKAQSDSTSEKKQRAFIATIRTTDNKMIKGRLQAVNDSQLVLNSYSGQQPVLADNVKSFTLKRKNSILKGALIGLGVGAVTGIIIGLASGDDPVMSYPDPNNDPFGLGSLGVAVNNSFALTAGQKAAGAGIALGTTGAVVGTIIGALAKKKFIIGGRRQKFHDLQGEIMMKLVRK